MMHAEVWQISTERSFLGSIKNVQLSVYHQQTTVIHLKPWTTASKGAKDNASTNIRGPSTNPWGTPESSFSSRRR